MLRLKIAGVAFVLGLLAGGWLLLRDAPIFAVQRVTITGLGGPGAAPIRASLEDAARAMTTTDLKVARLRAAVSSYAEVKDLRVQTQLPHGLRIDVIQELPVGTLVAGGERVPVAADGRILRGLAAPPGLASIPLAGLPSGAWITDGLSIGAVELLDIAPSVLRLRVGRVYRGPRGLSADLRNGPAAYFGDATRLHAKWAALARVLADPASRGAVYIDVRTPERPAAAVGDPATSVSAATAPGTAGGALVSKVAPGG